MHCPFLRVTGAAVALWMMSILSCSASPPLPETEFMPAPPRRQRSYSHPELDAEVDARIHYTCLEAPDWPVAEEDGSEPVWESAIPRRIIQIWFGGQSGPWEASMQAWRDHANTSNMEYWRVSDADLPALRMMASPRLADALRYSYDRADLRGASDIARYIILEHWGGIYVDADMRVPKIAGQPIALDRLMPLRGLVVVSDGEPVDWGTGGLHLLNGILASCPQHPTLKALNAQIPDNMQCCAQQGDLNPVTMMGPMALTRLTAGPVTVVPTIFWDALGVADPAWR